MTSTQSSGREPCPRIKAQYPTVIADAIAAAATASHPAAPRRACLMQTSMRRASRPDTQAGVATGNRTDVLDGVGTGWLSLGVTTIALFHSVLGVRQGVLDAADRFRAAGHEVVVADLYDGRTFDDYPPAMSFAWEEVGPNELMRRADEAVADLADGIVTAGFSLGCIMAVHVATQRPVSGVLMIAGAVPVSALGSDARWPAGVPAQTHSTLHDPWREQEELDQAVHDVEAAGGTIEVFDYEGAGHLFTDPTLPAEYDPAATEMFWTTALPFVASCG
jgi:dienelactone hydrolase